MAAADVAVADVEFADVAVDWISLSCSALAQRCYWTDSEDPSRQKNTVNQLAVVIQNEENDLRSAERPLERALSIIR